MRDVEHRVAYVAPIIPSYKVWIMEALAEKMGNSFFAIHGKENLGTVPRDVGRNIGVENNIIVNVRYWKVRSFEFMWMCTVWWIVKQKPDVVVLIDQVKILSNYPIHFWARITNRRVVFYSHGFDHQASLRQRGLFSKLTERLRLFSLRRASAVVVYDSFGRDHLIEKGVECPIYCSNNTLDTKPLLEYYTRQSSQAKNDQTRRERDIPDNAFVVTFLGRLVTEKRIDVFIDVLAALEKLYGNKVYGMIIGDGPEMNGLKDRASGSSTQFLGYREGSELRGLLAASDVIFIPGMVGLAIVESFCASAPLITVRHDFHSPEISYLEHEVNGILISDFSVESAMNVFAKLIANKGVVQSMGRKALETAQSDCDPQNTLRAFFAATAAQ
jgi:1,2-diacylglycerol 3-alpha-glucosyltransferase